jgi:hypothetical protein
MEKVEKKPQMGPLTFNMDDIESDASGIDELECYSVMSKKSEEETVAATIIKSIVQKIIDVSFHIAFVHYMILRI